MRTPLKRIDGLNSTDSLLLLLDGPAPPGQLSTLVLSVTWQAGPIKEHGVNGVQVDDVLEVCLERLRNLNQPPYACRENSLAITKIEEAVMWLEKRTKDRETRGVEGTNTP